MKINLKPFTIRLIAAFLLVVSIVVIHSCKKDKAEKTVTASTTNPTVVLAQKWYQSTYPNVNNATTTKQTSQSVARLSRDWSKKFFPVWSRANVFTEDGMTFIELPATKAGDMAVS